MVVRRGKRVLLAQRPTQGRWGGMWEFPRGPLAGGETHEQAAVRLANELAGLAVELGPELMTVRHGVTRFRITLVCFEARHRAGGFRSSFYQQGRWVAPARLVDYPVSVPQRRLTRSQTASKSSQYFGYLLRNHARSSGPGTTMSNQTVAR